MPTAVMIESSENTRSMTMICRMTEVNVAFTTLVVWSSAPSMDWWISVVLFQIRNRPPRIRIRSRPEISMPNTLNSGVTSPTIQASTSSRPMRMNIAMKSPRRRANSRLAFGSLSTRIEMKMMLSMPSTSSSRVSVAKAIQVWGLVRSSIMAGLCALRWRMGRPCRVQMGNRQW